MSDSNKPPGKPQIVIEDGWSMHPKVRVLRGQDDQQKLRSLNALREAVSRAEQGQVREAIIVTFTPDGTYTFVCTGADQHTIPKLNGVLHLIMTTLSNKALHEIQRNAAPKAPTPAPGGDA